MAKKSLMVKTERLQEAKRLRRDDPEAKDPRPSWYKKYSKYPVRTYFRCQICGRARAYYRKFGICRVCFRSMSHLGQIPGVKKASW